MITVISGTNRIDSYTELIADHYAKILQEKGQGVKVLSLTSLAPELVVADMYEGSSPLIRDLISTYIEPVEKFLFVIPEYNGSYPGVLKTFLDFVHPKYFREKKAAIVGISSGKAGNLRGQDHLTSILHYLRMHVHYQKPKLSGIEDLVDDKRKLVDEQSLILLREHADLFVKW